jgi:tRNA1Val (adenine37-N6)-methyltransferase
MPTDCIPCSEDSLFAGELICRQHRHGYRFSIDAILAAHFCPPAQRARVLDLGAGSGVISLIVQYRYGRNIEQIIGLEIQPQLVQLAETNFRLNGYQDKCRCLEGNVCHIDQILPPDSFDQVICNPPFYQSGSGRQSEDEESRLARHQISATLAQFVTAAAFVVKNGGTAVLIYPAEQLAELANQLAVARLEMKRVQFIYNYPGAGNSTAQRVLVKCLKNGGRGVQVLPPFYVYTKKNGAYSDEMQQLYQVNDDDANS